MVIINIILGFFALYIFICIFLMVSLYFDEKKHPEKYKIEMYKGEPRYEHTRDGWYGEVEFYDRKKKKYIVR